MKVVLTLIAVSLAVSTARASTSSDLLDSKVALALAEAQYGPSHPRLIELRAEVSRLEAAGATVNWDEANSALEQAVQKRHELCESRGRHHPAVIEMTRRIERLAAILADDVR